MKPLAGQWITYLDSVLSHDAGAVQIIETRRAFYAGAEAMLRVIMTGLDPGSEPTDADEARMVALDEELLAFARDVAGGRA